MRLCVPSRLPGGMLAKVSDSFERCQTYTIVAVHSDDKKSVETVANFPDDPGMLGRLLSRGVHQVLTANIEPETLNVLWQNMVQVYIDAVGTVEDTVRMHLSAQLRQATVENLPGGDGEGE